MSFRHRPSDVGFGAGGRAGGAARVSGFSDFFFSFLFFFLVAKQPCCGLQGTNTGARTEMTRARGGGGAPSSYLVGSCLITTDGRVPHNLTNLCTCCLEGMLPVD